MAGQLQPSGVTKKKSPVTVGKIIMIFLAFIVLLLVVLWFWSGSNGSLAGALSFAQRYLGQGQSLVVQDVSGSIRHGGHLGAVQWKNKDLQLELDNVDVQWEWSSLLNGKLKIKQLEVSKVQMMQKPLTAVVPESSSGKMPTPKSQTAGAPQVIMLPLEVEIKKFQVASIVVGDAKTSNEVISNLQGSYYFDKQNHVLKIDQIHVADGDYQAQVNLTALAPTLDASLKGKLITQVPESDKKVMLDVLVKIVGPLTKLNVDASAVATQEGDAAHSPKAELKAVVMPWNAAMVLPKADLSLQAFNLNAFWARAPVTLLSGTAGVSTSLDASGKEQSALLTLDIKNAYQGAIWQNRLPFSAMNGSLLSVGHTVTVQKLNISTGSGSIAATGKATLPPNGETSQVLWDLSATLHQIDPHLFVKDLASDQLSGTIKLKQSEENNIHFEIKLNAAQAANISQFRVKQVDMLGNFDNRVTDYL